MNAEYEQFLKSKVKLAETFGHEIEPGALDKWLRVCNECSHVYDLCGHDNCPECQRNREAAEELREMREDIGRGR